jgi:hypothetical protein
VPKLCQEFFPSPTKLDEFADNLDKEYKDKAIDVTISI